MGWLTFCARLEPGISVGGAVAIAIATSCSATGPTEVTKDTAGTGGTGAVSGNGGSSAGGVGGSSGAAGTGAAGGSGGSGTAGQGGSGSGGLGGSAGVGGSGGVGGFAGDSAGTAGAGGAGATSGAGGTGAAGGGGMGGVAGTGGDPDPGPESGGGDGCTDDSEVHSGTFTYYTLDAEKNGTCSLNQGQPPFWAAMNEGRFGNGGEACGGCIEVKANGRTAIVQVVDMCPADAANVPCQSTEHIDLSQAAFAALGINGKGSGSWQYIACEVSETVQIFTKGDSTEWWASLSIRKHRYRIEKVEFRYQGALRPLYRQPHNMWNTSDVATDPKLGLGPVRIRITDMYGHWIENLVTLAPGGTTDMELQFPACA